jgi:stage V sporulation protein D (sporulation-specific penicillin-binding protein)
MTKNNTISKWRTCFVLSLFLLVALIFTARLYLVQIVRGETYSNRAQRQHSRPTSDIFDRGDIFFETKDGTLIDAATIRAGYKIAINPQTLTHPEDVYNNLGFHLDLDEEFYSKRAWKEDDPYEEIAHRVDLETGQKIKDLDMNGVLVLDENWRHYPGKNLAAQTIGFIAFKENEVVGRYGLERFYEETLRRENETNFSNFFVEIFSSAKKTLDEDEKMEGSLVTTIDPELQTFVETETAAVAEKWNAKKVGIIVMNPQNGEILSLAQLL